MLGAEFLVSWKVSLVVPFLAFCVILISFPPQSSPHYGRQIFQRRLNFLHDRFFMGGINTTDWIQIHSSGFVPSMVYYIQGGVWGFWLFDMALSILLIWDCLWVEFARNKVCYCMMEEVMFKVLYCFVPADWERKQKFCRHGEVIMWDPWTTKKFENLWCNTILLGRKVWNEWIFYVFLGEFFLKNLECTMVYSL